MRAAALILVAAICLLAVSLRMQPFAAGSSDDWFASVPDGDSEAYYEARAAALSPKYQLQDYGVTLAFVAIATALVSRKRGLCAPASRLGFAVIAVAAPLFTVAGVVLDLIRGLDRREFPPWADSIGIPLAGVPLIALVLLAWAFAHFAFLSGVRRRLGVRISPAVLRGGNKWLLLVAATTALLLVGCVAAGDYLMAVPGAFWLYYYVSILAVRSPQGN